MKLCVLFFLTLMFGFFYPLVLIAQKQAKPVLPKRSIEIESLVNDAYLIPNEFGADLLIKLNQSNLIKEVKWKKEILEKAYILSQEVQNPIKKRLAIYGTSADSREAFLANSYDLDLDKISLQLRIIREVMKLDTKRARQMFGEISVDRKLLSANCEEYLIADVLDYYKVLGQVFSTFTPKERKANMHINFIIPFIEQISSNVQAGNVAEMILALQITPQEKENLIIAYFNSLKHIDVDNRSFLAMLSKDNLISNFIKLKETLSSKQTQVFLSIAFRDLIVRNLQTRRCLETAFLLPEKEITRHIEFFNKTLVSASPILTDEIKRGETDKSETLDDTLISRKAIELTNKYREIRFVATEKQESSEENDEDFRSVNEDEKAEISWQNKVSEFLSELESWNVDEESSEINFLNKKCVLYKALIQVVPIENQILSSKISRSYISFLEKSNTYKTEKAGWFFWFTNMFNSNIFNKNEKVSLLNNSSNETFRVYARFTILK